ncbi:MAG: DUF6288 domain-containing protein [Akkermansia sp.]
MPSLTSPLPSHFVLGQFRIITLLEQSDDSFLYDALDDQGQHVQIREFCPRKLAFRDPDIGKLRYEDKEEIRNELIRQKEVFDARYQTSSSDYLSELGTVYFIYRLPAVTPQNPSQPSPVMATNPSEPTLTDSYGLPPSAQKRTKSRPSHFFRNIFLLILLSAGAYFAYESFKDEKGLQDRAHRSMEKIDTPAKAKPATKTPVPPATVVVTPKVKKDAPTIAEQEPKPEETPAPKSDQKQTPVVIPEKTPEPQEPQEVTSETASDLVESKEEIKEEPEEQTSDEHLQRKSVPSAKSNQPTSPVAKKWLSKYAKHMTLDQWRKQYSRIWMSWFSGSPEVANDYITTLGPLGIRARQMDSSWASLEGFKALFPKCLTDATGDMAVNAYEVISVIPGAPAEGKINEGDLILGIDGQLFQSAITLPTKYGPYANQDTRGLDMHAGLLIDKAEGVGKIRLIVIPNDKKETLPQLPTIWTQAMSPVRVDSNESRKKGVALNIPVKGGSTVRINVTEGGNGNGSDGFAWKNLRFESATGGKVVNLEKQRPSFYNVGHGSAAYDPIKQQWWAHAASVIAFDAPKEGDWILKGEANPSDYCSVEVSADVSMRKTLPPSIKSACKEVVLNIDRIGSFADGFPKDCIKTRNVVDLLAGWLVAQQNEDGSWDRPSSYTGKHFDTAWSGLALLATGDKKYDPAIKKAAEYIAFGGEQDWWAVPAAMDVVFLSEYYLRYKDKKVLPTLGNQVLRMKSELLYGDFNTGHGMHPGYRGTGVSVGGSHMTLALALASKTPARIEDGIMEHMMDRAQELCPSGFGPYGRMAEDLNFEPNIEKGSTYSGRHGPYFIASLISGGPALFTKNCRLMYAKGPIGGLDQGHSTETMSLQWALPCLWNADPEAYYKTMEACRWKITLMRAFDSGMVFNPNRLELMTADNTLHVYIRTASWIMGLCANRQAIAITGKPGIMAKKFRNVPPVNDAESRLLQTYIRNWSIATAALGNKAPAALTAARAQLKKIPVKAGCRNTLMNIIEEKGITIAKSILAIPGLDPTIKAYCAELILGVDIRISCEQAKVDDKVVPGEYSIELEIQQPMSGRGLGLKDKEADKQPALKWPFSGSVSFVDKNNKVSITPVTWNDQTKFDGSWRQWNIFNSKQTITPSSPLSIPYQMEAHIQYKVGDLSFKYTRPISIAAFELGCAEKSRAITNDRKLWIPGILRLDHGNWGMSFDLPDGTFISAASQGNQIEVHELDPKTKEEKIWASPNDSSLMKGSKCMFHTASDWLGLECRVSEVKLLAESSQQVEDIKIRATGTSILDNKILQDRDAMTFHEISYPDKPNKPLEIEVQLPTATLVRGIDIRMNDNFARIIIEAYSSGKWIPVYWGSIGSAVFSPDKTMEEMYGQDPKVKRLLSVAQNQFPKIFRGFSPIKTNKFKITLDKNKPGGIIKLSELHVYKATPESKPSNR